MQKWLVKMLLIQFLMPKVSFVMNLCRKNRMWTVNFIKEWIKILVPRVPGVRREFQEGGTWYLQHGNAPEHYSELVSVSSGDTGNLRVMPSTLFPWFRDGWVFFISYITICDEREEIWCYFIDPTDCDERTNGDTGRSNFSGIISEENIVAKRAWTILSVVIDKYFSSLRVRLWPRFGNLIVTLCIIHISK
jgi:hypothetical protein